ncbi:MULTISPECIES: hypothetical protein [unclassified Treponema]|uniref:hypothetical protein n=1 Tax=unclassified Treponema TaxID=2638727 RepID=UPI0025DFC5E5|nr:MULTISPECIES: hypothetical protein [unclassified Treponema]
MEKFFTKLSLISVFAFLSCASAPVEKTPQIEEQLTEPIVIEEPEPVQEIEEEPVVIEKTDDEYTRSTSAVSVSKEVFNEDKSRILNIIKDLDTYMKNMDYRGWISYLDADSLNYWSKRQNLQKAANRLPKKGLRLNTIEDYFKFVFIPARAGHTVDEIRYETKSLVKAVQVQNNTDVVYYNFHKVNDQWKLVLPKNPD